MGLEPVRIEIYYTGGCPNRETTLRRVWAALKELRIAGEVREVRVDPTWAPAFHFLGSPTVHVNGVDIEPSARTSSYNGVMCRTYRDGEQIEGAPSTQLIRQAILDFGASSVENDESIEGRDGCSTKAKTPQNAKTTIERSRCPETRTEA